MRDPRLQAAVLLTLILLMLTVCRYNAGSGTSGATTPAPTVSPAVARQGTEGCGHQVPAAERGTTLVATLLAEGVTRSYRLHIPSRYQGNQPVPLIFNFHGHDSNARQQEVYTGFSALADQHDFVVVYPQGLTGSDGGAGWNTHGPNAPHVDDVAFVGTLLSQIEATLCIDRQRIFATGISNGGGMTALLACRMAGQFAAFAPVSGAFYPIPGGCHPQRSVPLLEFHGTGDFVVPYDGEPRIALPPIGSWLREWASRDGCQHGPQVFWQQADVTAEEWTACTLPGLVVHYRIAGGGHTWPGAFADPLLGRTTHTIDATSLIWQFFTAHPLTGKGKS